MSAHLYILSCADGSCYVCKTRAGLETRVAEHQAGGFNGYTALRRPVTLVFHQHFEQIQDAVSQIKGWRWEKEAHPCRGALHHPRASFETRSSRALLRMR